MSKERRWWAAVELRPVWGGPHEPTGRIDVFPEFAPALNSARDNLIVRGWLTVVLAIVLWGESDDDWQASVVALVTDGSGIVEPDAIFKDVTSLARGRLKRHLRDLASIKGDNHGA